MRVKYLVAGILAAVMAAPSLPAAEAEAVTTLNFAVMRNGDQIGTSTLRLRHSGRETVAEIATHIRVTIGFLTVYRFDQTETEHWADGKLVALNSMTDDNGTLHRVKAARSGAALAVEANGKLSEVDPAVVPVSLWNASLLSQTMALNPQDGSMTPVSVIDHGEEQLVLQGRPTTARHYSIKTSFPQDVWYDQHHRLVQVELRGSDGSRIQYRPA